MYKKQILWQISVKERSAVMCVIAVGVKRAEVIQGGILEPETNAILNVHPLLISPRIKANVS